MSLATTVCLYIGWIEGGFCKREKVYTVSFYLPSFWAKL